MSNNNKLAGKVAVVTGASKGIGAAIAKQLASDGAAVVVNYASSKSGADKIVAEITKAGGRAVAIQGDVAKRADIEKLFAETKKAFGTVNILVNNAGIYEFAPLEQITEEHFRKQFDLNVLGLLLTTQEAVKHFPATGGNVINISSLVSTLAPANASVYSATKGAVDTITGSLAKELGTRNIRVNAVRPGLVETEGTQTAGFTNGDFHDQYVKNAPLGRIGRPQDIASAVAYLASDESTWVTGETLLVSGGHR
ncbi:MAG TPA: glucose 1-dehydrogenase [Candidatus Sulfotelmatobacter sp.]|jgi:3-oxoacyl-[acyl-carrier protein] reductase|nr:glucose 1-dehydrogenase [Candidatus Sulfotelmatobacter sp.]